MFCFNRPDGEKKAYVKLTSEYDAIDTANKVIICFLGFINDLFCNFFSFLLDKHYLNVYQTKYKNNNKTKIKKKSFVVLFVCFTICFFFNFKKAVEMDI
jgi:hypothetical protein